MSHALAREFLSKTALFEQLDADALDGLAAACALRSLSKGATLFQQGDPSDSLYIIVEGSANLSVLTEDGRELIVNVAHPGESFGEIALLDGFDRSASCTMRQDGRILALPRAAFLALIENPSAARSIIAQLCAMLRSSTERLEQMALHPLRARVAYALRDHARETSPPEIRLTQQELAQICGAARPRVNQVLKSFEEEGLIGKQGRVIHIIDPEGLMMVAEETLDN